MFICLLSKLLENSLHNTFKTDAEVPEKQSIFLFGHIII